MAPILCYVTDRKLLPAPQIESLLAAVRSAIAAGVDWIQIREKDLCTRELKRLAHEAVAAARGTSSRILINDRLDVALAAGADGVHLGTESLPVAEVVAWCAKHVAHFVAGASCHSLAEAQAAEKAGASYLMFGPIFATPSKLAYGPPQGLQRLEEICRSVKIPVLAIGGVNLENAASCLRAGASGIAAIRLFQEAANMRRMMETMKGLA